MPPLLDDGKYISVGGIYVPTATATAEGLAKARFDTASDSERLDAIRRGKFFSDVEGIARSSGTVPGTLDKPWDTPSFSTLRRLRRRSPIDRQIINVRCQQIKQFAQPAEINPRGIGYRVVHDRQYSRDYEITDDVARRCAEVEKIIQNTTRNIHTTFRDFLVEAVEDELVVDRKAIVRYRKNNRVVQYHLLPGDTIRPRLHILLPFALSWKTDDEEYVAERLSQELFLQSGGQVDIDLTKAAYVQVIDENITGAWTEEEMSLDITNPSSELNRWGYGESLLQRSVEWSTTFLEFWRYTTELVNQYYPDAFLALYGDYSPMGLENFKQQLAGETGPGRNYRMPVIPNMNPNSKMEVVKVRESPKDMLFQELISRAVELKTGAFQMDPTEIGWSPMTPGASNSLITGQNNGPAREQQMTMQRENGLHGLLNSLSRWITFGIVKENYDDLQAVFEGLDAESEDARSTRVISAMGAYMTMNEARKIMGLAKMKKFKDMSKTNVADLPMNMSYYQFLTMASQSGEQAQQQGQYDQGDFGGGFGQGPGKDDEDDSDDDDDDEQRSAGYRAFPSQREQAGGPKDTPDNTGAGAQAMNSGGGNKNPFGKDNS